MLFPQSILDQLQRTRVVAGFAVQRVEWAVPLVQALARGGITAVELTLRTPVAIEAVSAIHKACPDVLLGVGTLLKPEQVVAVREAGADFGVSPGMNPRVVEAARAVDLPFAPGICTPSELEQALEMDCRLVKFFPAEGSGGIAFLKSMAAPYKHLGVKYFPFGGIKASNMVSYLKEDIVAAVGGSWMVPGALLENEDWAGIESGAAEVRRAVAEI
jgi:2-dehydro-3-deoxyphosphogluconate aldolase/(4S)-4-hydroxy-2-oxoglutarate aldolase